MSLGKKATSGFIWTFLQQFGNQVVGFAVSIVLARILLPADFGLIGMIAIFYSIGRSLMDSGLTQSLVRSGDLDQDDFSTVFYFNLVASVILYLLIYLAAPLIADFYGHEILKNIVRLYCITFVIDAFTAVQRARMTKGLDFKTQTLIAIPSTIIGGVTGVTLALMDYGVWSLVWSTIVTSLFGSVQFWVYSKWTPSLRFNYEKFKDHINFGYKITLSGLLSRIFNNIYLVIIGKYFSAADLGFYTRAETTKQLPVRNLSNALNKVTFPLFATIQDDDQKLKQVYKKIMKSVIFIVAPVLVILAVIAEPLFRLVFTEKWLPAVPYFQLLCASGILYPIHSYNLNILKVKGRSDLFLKLEVYKKIITVIVIAVTLPFGIIALIIGQIFTSLIAFFINTYYTGKFIKYSAIEQSKDILPVILIAMIAGFFVFVLQERFLIDTSDALVIGSGILLGGMVYLVLIYSFQASIPKNLKSLISKR